MGDVGSISQNDDYFVTLYHPVTTEMDKNEQTINNIVNATSKFNIKNIIIWPNSDAGSEQISKKFRTLRELNAIHNYKILKNLPIEYYIPLIKHAKCLVGNSSSAIRDGSFVGAPAVNVGTRQNNRLFGPNVVQSDSDENSIFKSIKLQLKKKYKPSNLYGSGDSSKKIIQILKQLEKFSCQKVISY